MFDWLGHIAKTIGGTISAGLIALAGIFSSAPQIQTSTVDMPGTIVQTEVPATTTAMVQAGVDATTTSIRSQLKSAPIVNPEKSSQKTEISIPTVIEGPQIVSFQISPAAVSLGDNLTLSWTAKNVFTCVLPVFDPSTLNVPFTGKLPQGTLSFKLATNSGKSLDIWIVCADKEWVTTTAKQTVQILPPELVGTPTANTDSRGYRYISAPFKGATSAKLSCVVADYVGPFEPPKVVNSIISPEDPTAAMSENLIAGTALNCTIAFTGVEVQSSFSVAAPAR
jgi:hypothetical protein